MREAIEPPTCTIRHRARSIIHAFTNCIIMKFGAIIIGDEILSGKRQDKHMAQDHRAARRARAGARAGATISATTRSSSPRRCKRTFAADDVVFSFGGIGATPDDHTRQCAARAAGVALRAASRCGSRDPGALRRRPAGRHAAAPRDGRVSRGLGDHPESATTASRASASGAIISCPDFRRWRGR